MERVEKFSFDDFRLTVRFDASGRKHFTLSHGKRVLKNLLNPTLELLHFMAMHPNADLSDDLILKALWPDSGPEIVERHVSYLRGGLGDDPKDPAYIKTVHGRGYKFLCDVTRDGGGVEAYPKWDRARVHELMRGLTRGPDSDPEDLRISATSIGTSLDDLDLRGLLKRGVRIRVLFINPENKALTTARHGLRQDKSPSRCLRELDDQIEDMRKIARLHPFTDTPGEQGMLDFEVSDAMPSGLVIHTREWALLGVYPAHDAFIAGPMLEAGSWTETWETLHRDWKARWDAAIMRRSRA